MNKTVAIVAGLVVVLLVGGAAYYVGMNRGDDESGTSNVNTTDAENKNDEEQKNQGNDLVQSALDNVKSGVPTIQHTRILTEETDENNLLGKGGEYQYAGYFFDTRTEYSPANENGDAIEITADNYGTTAGGAIEVFASPEDASRRGELLEGFQTGFINAGPYRVVDNIVIRVSENYTASEQQSMLDLLEDAVSSSD